MRETTRNQYQETNNRCVQNRKSTGTETAYRDHNQGIHCFAERIERGREGERETERQGDRERPVPPWLRGCGRLERTKKPEEAPQKP